MYITTLTVQLVCSSQQNKTVVPIIVWKGNIVHSDLQVTAEMA